MTDRTINAIEAAYIHALSERHAEDREAATEDCPDS